MKNTEPIVNLKFIFMNEHNKMSLNPPMNDDASGNSEKDWEIFDILCRTEMKVCCSYGYITSHIVQL